MILRACRVALLLMWNLNWNFFSILTRFKLTCFVVQILETKLKIGHFNSFALITKIKFLGFLNTYWARYFGIISTIWQYWLFHICTFWELALRSPTATGSPFRRSLASWFGPDFEKFRLYNFPTFSKFFEIFRFFLLKFSDFFSKFSDCRFSDFFTIVIGFYCLSDDVYKISFKSVEGIRSYEGGTDRHTDKHTDTQTFILIGWLGTFWTI